MCRFLVLRSEEGFDPAPIVEEFRERCRRSPEFQGHGYGMAHLARGRWERYRTLTPVWEDSRPLPREVQALVLHARSAFRDEGIDVENNMPFYRGDLSFVFNGEIRGIRLRADGRIGAEKIFHVILEQGTDRRRALAETDRIVLSRSRYLTAMNVALTDGTAIYAHCRFSERPEYFTLHYRDRDPSGVSSDRLDGSFLPFDNGETRVL
jgi:glutamine amidotransferase